VLDYAVPFPLSLVVSRVTLTRYQLLFRYLLSLRHLETSLVSSWTDHNKIMIWTHRSSNPRIEQAKRKAWALRARMLIFVQQLIYYSTAEVIEPNWQGLMNRLKADEKWQNESETNKGLNSSRTVDALMQDHVDFLATCLKECMLTNSKLLKINARILTTCSQYTQFTSSLARYINAADPELSGSKSQPSGSTTSGKRDSQLHRSSATTPNSVAADPSKIEKLEDGLRMFEHNFTRHLKILLDTLNYLAATETVVFLSLCARLSTASDAGRSV